MRFVGSKEKSDARRRKALSANQSGQRPSRKRHLLLLPCLIFPASPAFGETAPNLIAPGQATKETATPTQVAASDTHHFSIPPQHLDTAMSAFAQATGMQFFLDAHLAQGVTSLGLEGDFTSDQALRRLLRGTGLTFRHIDANTVTLEKLPVGDGTVLPGVSVTGESGSDTGMIGTPPPAYPGGQVATGGQVGLLGNRDIMDTPFSSTNYTEKTVKNQQARSLADVIDNDPSVRNIWSRSSYADQYMIRGFPVYNDDVALNGLYGILPRQKISAAIAERIEILRGPNALLNGVSPGGSIGGSINLVSKLAGDDPLTELTSTYDSALQFGGEIDLGRRFGADKQFGARFSGVYRDGDTAIDHQSEEFGVGNLGLDYRGDRFRLAADIGYQDQDFKSSYSQINLASGLEVPDAPDASHNFSEKWAYAKTRDLFGMVRGEYDLTDNVTVFAAFGARDSDQTTVGTTQTIINEDGDFSGTAYKFPFFQKAISAQVGGRAAVQMGAMRHDFSLAASTLRMKQGYGFFFGSSAGNNIFDPVYHDEPDFPHVSSGKSAETKLNSIAAADVMNFVNDRIQLTAGARLQQIKIGNFDVNTGDQTSEYNEHAVTPAVGILVKPWENVAVYANYIEGLAQGPTAPTGTTNEGRIFAPYRTKQYEVGAKVDLGTMTATLAAFQITQPSAYTDAATNTYVVDGKQRNRGLELNLFGEPITGFRVLGGATLIDGKLTKTAGGSNDGNKAIGVPTFQLNAGAEWDTPFIPGLTLTGRVIYTSKQYLDAANDQQIPDWTRVDLGARYTVDVHDTPVTLRANVENVFDTSYWSSTGGGYLSLGAPRTFLLSTSVNF
ncbi:MAG TPA: TonB-dependent receptor [Terriglobia bacterium]|nr:TonB-dependent receptor [Terriglobia bacterium]